MNVKAIMDEAARAAILANYQTLCRLVGIPDLTLEESLAELLRVSLFEKRAITNPLVEFKNREKNGDFEPLRDDEIADDLMPGREPMTDAEFADAKKAAMALAEFWEGASSAKPFEVLSRAIMMMEPDEAYYGQR